MSSFIDLDYGYYTVGDLKIVVKRDKFGNKVIVITVPWNSPSQSIEQTKRAERE